MAYRRRQVVSRSSTFKEDINVNRNDLLQAHHNINDGSMSAPPLSSSIHNSLATPSFNNSLAAQAIKASATRRDPSHSFAIANSSLPIIHHENHTRSKVLLSFTFFSFLYSFPSLSIIQFTYAEL